MYRGAKLDQVVYLRTQTPFSTSYGAVTFVNYYKSSPFLKQPNSALVKFNGIYVQVDVKDLFKTQPKEK